MREKVYLSNREQDRQLLEQIDNGSVSVGPEFDVEVFRDNVERQSFVEWQANNR